MRLGVVAKAELPYFLAHLLKMLAKKVGCLSLIS
jgi:hypothetical protein